MLKYCQFPISLLNVCITTLHLLLGNEVHISVNTDTEYEKKDANNRFGLKCQVVGYEQTIHTADVSVYLGCLFFQVLLY